MLREFSVGDMNKKNYVLNEKPFQNKNVIIHPTAEISQSAILKSNVVIGKNCSVGHGAYLSNCTIMPNTKILDYSVIKDSIIGYNCEIKSWTRIENLSVLGDDVKVNEGLSLSQEIILPNKEIEADIRERIVL